MAVQARTTLQTPCDTGLTRDSVLKANCRSYAQRSVPRKHSRPGIETRMALYHALVLSGRHVIPSFPRLGHSKPTHTIMTGAGMHMLHLSGKSRN